MSNIFDEVKGDISNLEEQLLGPDYNYSDQIKSPEKLGMSSKGSMSTLSKDINGLVSYVELLVSGKSDASKTGKPLGDKFFMETGAKCTDTATNKQVTRSIYVNNVPDGSIPFISSGMGTNFSDFEGLVPGVLSNVSRINPLEILQAFVSGSNPDCQAIKMETIDANNNKSFETKYLTNLDIQNMNNCWFPDKKNPVTGEKCSEAFSNITNQSQPEPIDLVTLLYLCSLGAFGAYISYEFINKIKN